MTPNELLEIWASLATPITNHELEALEVAPLSGVWVARDNADHHHLLLRVDEDAKLRLDESHGLSVKISRHRIAGRGDAPYLDFTCLEPGAVQTFATVAANIANAVAAEPLSARTAAVATAVREWRWFWGVDPSRLSKAEAIGLFGELWFLHRWAGVTTASVEAWVGSDGSRHDFQWPTSSVEVKTTARSGAVMHTIENLDQLDSPVSGELYLFSLRIVRDALAANSIGTLVEAARRALQNDPVTRSGFLSTLAQRGYTPLGRDESDVTYRVVDEALYRVTGDFPRLTQRSFPTGLPTGIAAVSYILDVNACAEWRTSATPDSWNP